MRNSFSIAGPYSSEDSFEVKWKEPSRFVDPLKMCGLWHTHEKNQKEKQKERKREEEKTHQELIILHSRRISEHKRLEWLHRNTGLTDAYIKKIDPVHINSVIGKCVALLKYRKLFVGIEISFH